MSCIFLIPPGDGNYLTRALLSNTNNSSNDNMTFPAQDYEELRQQLILIRQGEISLDVGKKILSALVKMIEEPELVALNNIVDLAEKTQVSPASVTRLCRLLGFQSFRQFQQIFKQRAKKRSDYYTSRLSKLMSRKGDNPKLLLLEQSESVINNLNRCIQLIDDDSISQAKNLLALSRRVYVFGHKQSSALANLLKYGLSLIRFDVHRLQQAEHGVAAAVNQLRKNDLLVVISSSPYASLSLEVVSLAKQRECKILAITDSELSPLCEYASLALIVSTHGIYYNNSLSATVIFIESLLSLTAIELGEAAISKLNDHEMMLMQLRDSN